MLKKYDERREDEVIASTLLFDDNDNIEVWKLNPLNPKKEKKHTRMYILT